MANAEAAFKLYEQCLGGQITFMRTYGNSPMKDQASKEWQDKICHATLTLENTSTAGSDLPLEQYEETKGFSLLLNLDNPVQAERIFQHWLKTGL